MVTDDGGPSSLDATSSDADSMTPMPDPERPDNAMRDSDCDGLSDAEEYGTVWPSGMRTDPANPDSDGDGLPDGLEVGRTASVDPSCTPAVDADPGTRTDPTDDDTDDDGLLDGDEDTDQDGVFDRTHETNPRHPDTDGDGRCDGPNDVVGVCTGGDPDPFIGGMDTDQDGLVDRLDPNASLVDTDGDMLCDGPFAFPGVCEAGEDLDADGVVSPGESNPSRIDTDCDGLVDGPSYGAFVGERALGTDPTRPDTDGDGLSDGLEAGIATTVDPINCPDFVPDGDPTTSTNPTVADSDGDGVPDGAEDTNQNGVVDPGELDPNNGQDAGDDPTVEAACGLNNLIPLDEHTSFAADLKVTTAQRGADSFSERATVTDAMGRVVGLMGFNPMRNVAFVALNIAPVGGTAGEAELSTRAVIATTGALSTPITRNFRTWDGFDATHATYLQAGTDGVKARANAIASALHPAAATLLDTTMDVAAMGGFRVEVEYVRRSAQTMIVLLALVPEQSNDEGAQFALRDLAGGSSLGQFGDALGLQCDRFESSPVAPLDILWAIDNSASMPRHQGAVAASAAAMEARLDGAGIDWRAAVVTSGFFQPRTGSGRRCTNVACGETSDHQCRPFTSDVAQFTGWMTQGNATWIGAGGSCNVAREEITRGAQMILSDPPVGQAITFMPPQPSADNVHLRDGANLLVIMMGDADDQFYTNPQLPMGIDTYETFFRGLPVPRVILGGILCPEPEVCGEAHRTPRVAQALINRFGGTIGSLEDLASIGPSVAAIIDDAVGTVSPYVLTKDAIPSTIKVVIEDNSTAGACNWSDIPRSRTSGWDYDAGNRTITFFGDCRPDPLQRGKRVSVSYRYWSDLTDLPDGAPCGLCGGQCIGLQQCDEVSCTCSCPANVTCNAGLRWDADACDCVCDAQSLACDSTHVADPNLCACVCKPDCGGCPDNFSCQASLCMCEPLNL